MSLKNDVLVTKLDPDYLISSTKKMSEDQLNKLIFLINSDIDSNAEICTRPGVPTGAEMIFVKFPHANPDNKDKLETIAHAFDKSLKVLDLESGFLTKAKSQFGSKVLKKIPLLKPMTRADFSKLSEFTTPDIALYFGYAQTYIISLIPLALCGLTMRYTSYNWEFNYAYTVYLFLWSFLFINYWKFFKQPSFKFLQNQYASNSSNHSRGEIFGDNKSNVVFIKKLFFIPVAWTFMTCLFSFQLVCFVIEIFLTQFYDGPLKSIVSLFPTILLSVFVPVITAVYSIVVNKMVLWENNPANAHRSTIEKKFTLTFLTSYAPLLITLFLYLPYGYLLNSQMDSITDFCHSYHLPVVTGAFEINIQRFRAQFFYFTVTNQVIALLMDIGIPFATEFAYKKFVYKSLSEINSCDNTQEASFLSKARDATFSPWGAFDPIQSYSKYIIQFGFIVMFSTIWPLAPLFALVFNIIVFKVDMWKVLNKTKVVKPDYTKTEMKTSEAEFPLTIDPWNQILSIVAWISSLVTPSIFIMYKYSLLPGVGIFMEKRSLWYMETPFIYDWKTVVSIVAIVEHIGFVLNYLFSKLASFKAERSFGSKTPLVKTTNVEKPAIIVSEPIESEKSDKVVSTGAQRNALNHSDSFLERKQLPDTPSAPSAPAPAAAPANTYSQIPKTSQAPNKPSYNQSPITAAPVSQNETRPREDSIVAAKAPETHTTQQDDDNSVAGATLPKVIPTSQNFDSRQNVTDSDSCQSSSVPSGFENNEENVVPTNATPTANPVPKNAANVVATGVTPAVNHAPTQFVNGGASTVDPSVRTPSVAHISSVPTQAIQEASANIKLAPSAAAAALKEGSGKIMSTVNNTAALPKRSKSTSLKHDSASLKSTENKKKRGLFSKLKHKL